MFDAKSLLNQLLGTAEKYAGKENIDMLREKAAANPTLTKVGAVGAAGVLLGTGFGRNLLKLGGAAAVAGLGYKAYQDWQAKQKGETTSASAEHLALPPQGSGFEHEGQDEQARALAYITAMIAAAKSDGQIDSFEQERIFAKLGEMNDNADARAFLMNEMMGPLDIDKVSALGKTREQAVEIYTASAMAIMIDTPEERSYMNTLADRMGLDRDLAAMIEVAVTDERAAS